MARIYSGSSFARSCDDAGTDNCSGRGSFDVVVVVAAALVVAVADGDGDGDGYDLLDDYDNGGNDCD